MTYTTIISKRVTCPMWKVELTLHGKYLLLEEDHHKAKFLSATCPIVENLRLPSAKPNKEYELFRYCKLAPCELLDDFEPVIDFWQSHSQ